jgi:uncharacterized protein YndB with AHSA1/START domain
MTNITKANEGTVRPTEKGFLLRFERELAHPVDTVWRAITEEHAQWLSGEGAEIELRVGGKVRMPAHMIESTVVEYDPPRVFSLGWDSPDWGDGGTVRWELSPSGDGTRLVLTHDHPPIDPAQQDEFAKRMGWPDEMKRAVPRTLAGWHLILDLLQQLLDGGRAADMPTPQDPGDAWQPTFEHYLETVDENPGT